MFVCILCVQSPWEPEGGDRGPETGVKGSFKLSHGCWSLNLGPLKEQLGLLPTKPHLQPPGLCPVSQAGLEFTKTPYLGWPPTPCPLVFAF